MLAIKHRMLNQGVEIPTPLVVSNGCVCVWCSTLERFKVGGSCPSSYLCPSPRRTTAGKASEQLNLSAYGFY